MELLPEIAPGSHFRALWSHFSTPGQKWFQESIFELDVMMVFVVHVQHLGEPGQSTAEWQGHCGGDAELVMLDPRLLKAVQRCEALTPPSGDGHPSRLKTIYKFGAIRLVQYDLVVFSDSDMAMLPESTGEGGALVVGRPTKKRAVADAPSDLSPWPTSPRSDSLCSFS